MSNKRILALVLAIVGVLLTLPVQRGAARTALSASPYCLYLGFIRFECHAEADGGTGSYTYQWTPTPTVGGEIAIMPCANGYRTVYLTVTDSCGATFSTSTKGYCGGRPQ